MIAPIQLRYDSTRTSLRCPLTTLAENPNKLSDSTEILPLSWSTQQKSLVFPTFSTSPSTSRRTLEQRAPGCTTSASEESIQRLTDMKWPSVTTRPQQILQITKWRASSRKPTSFPESSERRGEEEAVKGCSDIILTVTKSKMSLTLRTGRVVEIDRDWAPMSEDQWSLCASGSAKIYVWFLWQ